MTPMKVGQMPATYGDGTTERRRRLASRLCDSYAIATMREFYPPAMAVGLVGWALFVMVAVRLRRYPEVRITQSVLARVNHISIRCVRTHMGKLLEVGLLAEVNRFRGADGKTHITYALGETALAGLAEYDRRYPRDWERPARAPGLCHAEPREPLASALGAAEQPRTADPRSASELSPDQENLSSSRSRPSDPEQQDECEATLGEEEILPMDLSTEQTEIAKAHDVIAGCYRATCPEIVLVSAPGTPAEIAIVRRAFQERGGDVELLINAYRGACLVSNGDPSIEFVFANTRHLTAHIKRWQQKQARERARQAAARQTEAVPTRYVVEVSRSTAPVAQWLTAAAPLGVAAAIALERERDGVAA